MRIPCPFCGPRDAAEFSYLGDAKPKRPETAMASAEIDEALYDYIYLRDNPAGPLREYWYHGSGCHGWLVVERDTRTHRIIAASMAQAETPP
jgi:heterotetrameric sarcosine oxidase delta subunit